MGRKPCCDKVGLKKGKWTSDEDQILIKYILANGEGSWRTLPKNAGLLRCGKSCRLRWINYLRSDLKRGNITKEEEELIIKLHATLGNRWSLIAGHLTGRTDNEIKNYWNSHLSRKLLQPSATSDETKSSTSSSTDNLPPPDTLAVEDSARPRKPPRPNTKKKKLKTTVSPPPPPEMEKESLSTMGSSSGSFPEEEFTSTLLDEMLWEANTCQLPPAMVDLEAETCYWDNLFGTAGGLPDSDCMAGSSSSSSSSYPNAGETHHDDMLSWLWDVEDFGGFDNGNSCNMAGDDERHSAMVAWLLS